MVPAIAIAIIIHAALVRPSHLVAANSWNSGWSSTTTRLPCVAIAAMPLTTNDMARVPIRGLIRNFVTTTPLDRPTASPTPRAARIPTAGPNDTASWAAVAPASP